MLVCLIYLDQNTVKRSEQRVVDEGEYVVVLCIWKNTKNQLNAQKRVCVCVSVCENEAETAAFRFLTRVVAVWCECNVCYLIGILIIELNYRVFNNPNPIICHRHVAMVAACGACLIIYMKKSSRESSSVCLGSMNCEYTREWIKFVLNKLCVYLNKQTEGENWQYVRVILCV